MATKIIHKKSSVASSVPAAGDLEPGELAVNLADKKIFSKTTGGTVIEMGGLTQEEIEDFLGTSFLEAGNGVSLTYDDGNNQLLIESDTVEETVKNVSGGSLSKGTVVYQSGSTGTIAEVQAAEADVASKMPAIGILAETLADQAEGKMVLIGKISGLDTSGFSAGDTVFVSTTAGTLTNSPPAGETSLIQNIGKVIKVHASAGVIVVTGAGRSNATPNLDSGKFFLGNGSNQAASATFSTEVQGVDVTNLQGVALDASVGTPSDGDIIVYRSAGSDWVLEAKPAGGSNPAINDLTDVTITTVADNEVLAYDNGTGEWINQTAAEAGLAAASHTHTVADVTDLDADLATFSVPASTTISAFGATLVDDADAATARTTLGVDAAGTDNSTDVTLSGTGTYISIAGQVITVDPITESDISDLGAYITGITGEPLSDLSDVTITTIGSDEILKWNGSAWINNTLAEAGISATGHTHTVSDITDLDADLATFSVPASTTISAFGATLVDDADAATARTTLGVDAAGTDNSTDVTLSGTGTYISIAGQVITVDPITESDISDLGAYITGITGEPLSDLSDVTITSVASGEILKWNGTAWINQTLAEAGIAATGHTHTASDITDFDTEVSNNADVAANTAKVSNATHTGDVTGSTVLTIADNAVTLAKLADMATASFIGRNTAATGDPEVLSATTARSILNVEDGADVTDSANVTTALGSISIEAHSDVNTMTPTDGQVLTWDNANSRWDAATPSGGSSAINDLTDVTITTPADNEVLAYDNGTSEWINQTYAEAGLASLTGTETLTNKTITAPAISNPVITGAIDEEVYAWTSTSGAITTEMDPANGTIQTLTLTGNITSLTDNFAEGEAITLIVGGTASTITFPTTTWVNNGGSAPDLATTGQTVFAFWKVSTTLYGALVGDGS